MTGGHCCRLARGAGWRLQLWPRVQVGGGSHGLSLAVRGFHETDVSALILCDGGGDGTHGSSAPATAGPAWLVSGSPDAFRVWRLDELWRQAAAAAAAAAQAAVDSEGTGAGGQSGDEEEDPSLRTSAPLRTASRTW